MKKVLTILLVAVLALLVVACSDAPSIQETAPGSSVGTSNPETTHATDGSTAATNPTDTSIPTGDGDTSTSATNIATSPTEAPPQPTNPPVVETPQPTDPHMHTYREVVTKPTCTEEGYTTYSCSCGDVYTDNKVQPTGHNYGDWKTTKEPTTSSRGEAERKCENCGNVETKELSQLVESHTHSYKSEVTKSATCSAEGVRTYTCSCGDIYTEAIAKEAHKYTTTVTNPTCMTGGYTTYKCSCGDTYTGAKTNALGHSYKNVVTNPTCLVEGYTTHTCTRCAASYVDSIVSALGHAYKQSVTKATCTTGGYTTHTCSRCNTSYIDSRTNATGHTYVTKQTKAPTCTDNGVNTHTCSNCGNAYTSAINAIGHNYKVTSDTKATCTVDGKKVETCSNCNHSKTVATYPATGHQHKKTEETNSTCSVAGYVKTICTDCGVTLSKTDKALLPHNYSKEMILSQAVTALTQKGNYTYNRWCVYSEWKVDTCSVCGDIDIDNIRYAYSTQEAAEIMLGWVNELRREHFGSTDYDLQLNPYLMEIAAIRAEELKTDFSHSTKTERYGADENISQKNCQNPLYSIFLGLKNSPDHYNNMIDPYIEYFAFDMSMIDTEENYLYAEARGVQLFWEYEDLYEYKTINNLW